MRADRHYVDLLASSSAGQPVRMIALGEIDAPLLAAHPERRLLIDSIRTHGIVQPLLVRRREGRYAIVAGRQRLAAARTLRLSEVPCIVHEVDDEKAAALATADNLHGEPAVRAEAPAARRHLGERVIAEHLVTINRCVSMSVDGMPAFGESMLNVVRAHAWRAARLVDALDVIAGVPFPITRERAVASIVDEVIDGFAPECALNGVALRSQVHNDVSSSGLNGRELSAAIAAGVLAMLPLVERAPRPTIVVKASQMPDGALSLSFIETDATVGPRAARAFFEDADADTGSAAVAASAAAQAVLVFAERQGGTATLELLPNGAALNAVIGRR